jgi:hypothetical protein
MRTYLIPAMLLASLAAAGCSHGHNDSVISYIDIHGGKVAVSAPHQDDAVISATGDLNIGAGNVPVNAAQRDLLKRYYSTAVSLRDHGIATGKAGIAVAGKALGSVASGLASGNTDKIDSEVNASAAKVEAQASLVCQDVAELRTTQDALASQLPVFAPYARIKSHDAEDCQDHRHERS